MINKKAVVTIVLIAINVLVFFVLTFQGQTESGEFLLSKGAAFAPYIIGKGEYYRLITSMFLHFGFTHLVNNMFVLGLMGSRLETTIGPIRFVIIYFVSGLCGNILSLISGIRGGSSAISAGASGAVFGVIGALLFVAFINRGRLGDQSHLSWVNMAIMIGLMLYLGFTSTGVDNFAHIGGLLSGFLLAVILYRGPKTKKRKDEWYEG